MSNNGVAELDEAEVRRISHLFRVMVRRLATEAGSHSNRREDYPVAAEKTLQLMHASGQYVNITDPAWVRKVDNRIFHLTPRPVVQGERAEPRAPGMTRLGEWLDNGQHVLPTRWTLAKRFDISEHQVGSTLKRFLDRGGTIIKQNGQRVSRPPIKPTPARATSPVEAVGAASVTNDPVMERLDAIIALLTRLDAAWH